MSTFREVGRMRKKFLILTVILMISVLMISCTENEIAPDQTEKEEKTEIINETTYTPEVTESVPEETPLVIDEDPMGKMILSEDEYKKLIHLWPIDALDVEQQGDVINLALSYLNVSLNLNYFFADSRSTDEIKAVYTDIISGEWEKDDYSAGPTLNGSTANGDSALCQIIPMGSYTELSLFISTVNLDKVEEYNAFFDSKWPNGLVQLNEELSEDSVSSVRIEIKEEENIVIYSKGYEFSADVTTLMDYYKELLSAYDDYEITSDYTSAEILACSKDDIIIKVYYYEFFEEVVFEYSIPLR